MRYRPLPADHDASPGDIRLSVIYDRLTRHRAGVTTALLVTDFEAHAADDVEWLLDHVDALRDEIVFTAEKREKERQLLISTANNELEVAERMVLRIKDRLGEASTHLQECQGTVEVLKQSPEIQLAAVRQELTATKLQVEQLKNANEKLEAKLKALPPTWAERLMRQL